MWDEAIWTYVAMEAVHACGNVIDLFTLWQGFKAGVRFAHRNADSERDTEPSWDEGGGKVASQTVAGPRNNSKPSKNVDKQIPGMKSSSAPGWICH